MHSKKIEELKTRIEQEKKGIQSRRENMARMRANKAPKHYQDSGKKYIEGRKKVIERYKEEINSIKNKQKNMGKATDSFKREMGKNTGKWLSNKIFGDGHSTPQRISVKVQKEQAKNDLREIELKEGRKLQKNENRKEIIKKGIELFSNEENNNEKKSINSKKDEIIATQIPNKKDEIMNLTNFLISTIKANGWKSAENEEYLSSLSDASLVKLEQCVIKLKSINEDSLANYVNDEIKKLKQKKIIQKYLLFVGIGLLFIIAFILHKTGFLK